MCTAAGSGQALVKGTHSSDEAHGRLLFAGAERRQAGSKSRPRTRHLHSIPSCAANIRSAAQLPDERYTGVTRVTRPQLRTGVSRDLKAQNQQASIRPQPSMGGLKESKNAKPWIRIRRTIPTEQLRRGASPVSCDCVLGLGVMTSRYEPAYTHG